MNSQDKPIDGNDNLDESLSTSNARQRKEENSIDLWKTIHDQDEDAEIVTAFISVEAAAKNDAEALENLDADSTIKPPKKSGAPLDLDDWDFRNLDSTESEPISEPISEPSMDAAVDSESQDSANNDLW
ncbi:MAG: hypothetical protein HC936_14070 [Leptolyngbyaceae cyanobacterium SU_3_3]|nr:hypothetical protein [Leptolyngbyaceae cyanobacterium SU_3_3]